MRVPRSATTAAVALLATFAAAQRPAGDPAEAWQLLLARYDADGDGSITRSEHGRGDTQFARLDRDGDGVLTLDDLTQVGRRQQSRDPAGMRAEILGPLARAADADDDDTLTRAEWRAWLAHFEENGRLDRRDLELAGASGQRGQLLSRRLDQDRDGTLTIAEVRVAFRILDEDGDGTLRGDELGPPLAAKPPQVGAVAPDFDLPTLADPEQTIKLSSFAGDRPVALIFGSYT